MATEHVNIADGERHEPKGIASATTGEIYQADGSESGDWKQPTVALTVKMEDISTAQSVWVVAPFAGVIETIYSVIDGAITSADCGITTELAGVAVTGGGLTITQSGSAAGDVDSATPSALNVVAAGDAIEIISDGLSATAVDAVFTLVIRGS
jgi:hypothetical protein